MAGALIRPADLLKSPSRVPYALDPGSVRSRMTKLLLALLLASLATAGVEAQAVADTTAPSSYYPLQVGNVWQRAYFFRTEPSLFQREIVRDTLIDGTPYVLERSCSANGARDRDWQCSERFVRYDPASTDVRVRRADGGEDVLYCALGADFGADVDCGGILGYEGGYTDEPIGVRDDAAPVTAWKQPETLATPGPPPFLAGFGIGLGQREGGIVDEETLLHARVDGERYGYPASIDPEAPTRYAPLAVGNVWEYLRTEPGRVTRTGRSVVADSVVAGTRYVVQETVVEAGGFRVESTALVRFDAASGFVMRLRPGGGEAPVSCPLGSPYALTLPACLGSDLEGLDPVSVSGHAVSPGVGIRVGSRTVPMTSFKTFYTEGGGPSVRYGAGIGRLPQNAFPDCSTCSEEMTYLRLVDPETGGAREYGTRAVTVARDDRPRPGALSLRATPNPVADRLTVELTTPGGGEGTLEVFDARGRRVETRAFTGTEGVHFDVSGWAPGVYLIRATRGEHSVASRVVRL